MKAIGNSVNGCETNGYKGRREEKRRRGREKKEEEEGEKKRIKKKKKKYKKNTKQKNVTGTTVCGDTSSARSQPDAHRP